MSNDQPTNIDEAIADAAASFENASPGDLTRDALAALTLGRPDVAQAIALVSIADALQTIARVVEEVAYPDPGGQRSLAEMLFERLRRA